MCPKKWWRYSISSIEEANGYLPSFIKTYNEKFGKKPASSIDAHRLLTTDCNIERILCLHHERTIAKDLTISWQGKTYQINDSNGHHRLGRKKVLVLEQEEGRVEFIYKGEALRVVDFRVELASENTPDIEALLENWKKPREYKQSMDHPWKRHHPKQHGMQQMAG